MVSSQKKNVRYSIFLCLIVGLVWIYRNYVKIDKQTSTSQEQLFFFEGKTMGTTYTIKYVSLRKLELKQSVDSLLQNFNQSLSTYIPSSEISRFNRTDSLIFEYPYFYAVLRSSHKIYNVTHGAFDPTVMPLVNAWGFGPDRKVSVNRHKIDSLRQFIGFDKIKFSKHKVYKTTKNVQLDFSALAKGYGVDVVTQFLVSKGLKHFLVEIGGEMFAKGYKENKKTWRVGIDYPKPDSSQNKISGISELRDCAIATSGNYRNFYVKNGKKYAHTIDPKTGYPVAHNLLSASVFAPKCMMADGYATAFMVMGVEKAKKIAQENADIDIFLVYEENGKLKTYVSEGVRKYIQTIN